MMFMASACLEISRIILHCTYFNRHLLWFIFYAHKSCPFTIFLYPIISDKEKHRVLTMSSHYELNWTLEMPTIRLHANGISFRIEVNVPASIKLKMLYWFNPSDHSDIKCRERRLRVSGGHALNHSLLHCPCNTP